MCARAHVLLARFPLIWAVLPPCWRLTLYTLQLGFLIGWLLEAISQNHRCPTRNHPMKGCVKSLVFLCYIVPATSYLLLSYPKHQRKSNPLQETNPRLDVSRGEAQPTVPSHPSVPRNSVNPYPNFERSVPFLPEKDTTQLLKRLSTLWTQGTKSNIDRWYKIL